MSNEPMAAEIMADEIPVGVSDRVLAECVQASVDHLGQYTGCISELSADGIGEPYYVESGGKNPVCTCSQLQDTVIDEICQACSKEPHCCVDEASIDDWFEADSLRNATLEMLLEPEECLS